MSMSTWRNSRFLMAALALAGVLTAYQSAGFADPCEDGGGEGCCTVIGEDCDGQDDCGGLLAPCFCAIEGKCAQLDD
jgi:hypothetical protein